MGWKSSSITIFLWDLGEDLQLRFWSILCSRKGGKRACYSRWVSRVPSWGRSDDSLLVSELWFCLAWQIQIQIQIQMQLQIHLQWWFSAGVRIMAKKKRWFCPAWQIQIQRCNNYGSYQRGSSSSLPDKYKYSDDYLMSDSGGFTETTLTAWEDSRLTKEESRCCDENSVSCKSSKYNWGAAWALQSNLRSKS